MLAWCCLFARLQVMGGWVGLECSVHANVGVQRGTVHLGFLLGLVQVGLLGLDLLGEEIVGLAECIRQRPLGHCPRVDFEIPKVIACLLVEPGVAQVRIPRNRGLLDARVLDDDAQKPLGVVVLGQAGHKRWVQVEQPSQSLLAGDLVCQLLPAIQNLSQVELRGTGGRGCGVWRINDMQMGTELVWVR